VNAEDVVHRFVEAINRADPARLAALMTEDHVFIDRLVGQGGAGGACERHVGDAEPRMPASLSGEHVLHRAWRCVFASGRLDVLL